MQSDIEPICQLDVDENMWWDSEGEKESFADEDPIPPSGFQPLADL